MVIHVDQYTHKKNSLPYTKDGITTQVGYSIDRVN